MGINQSLYCTLGLFKLMPNRENCKSYLISNEIPHSTFLLPFGRMPLEWFYPPTAFNNHLWDSDSTKINKRYMKTYFKKKKKSFRYSSSYVCAVTVSYLFDHIMFRKLTMAIFNIAFWPVPKKYKRINY